MKFSMLKKSIIHALVVVFVMVGVQAPAQAALVGTQQLAQQSVVEQQRNDIRTVLARDDVRAALQASGVDADAAQRRVDNLSAAEVIAMHGRLDNLPAGADGLGIVFGVIFVFIVLDLLGATDIFPRI